MKNATTTVDKPLPKTLGEAWYKILRDGDGLKCPEGCKGCAVRWYGLVAHLIEKHGYTQAKAEKVATREWER